jgi:pilus assembly protein CpaE
VLLLPRWADPLVAGVMAGVDRLLLVMQQGVVNLREAKLTLDRLLESAPLDRERVTVVVNRHQRSSPVGFDEIARTLGVETVHTLPNDFALVEQSIESGIPLMAQAPRCPVGRALTQLIDVAPAPRRPSRLLAGLFHWARA